MEEDPVTACDDNKIFLSFYLWLLSFYYSIRTLLMYFLRKVLDHRS